jgi:hypothetical protein
MARTQADPRERNPHGAAVRRPAVWAVGALPFIVAATANAAGYRYGVSDQAFYIPDIIRSIDPAAFPRDAALIASQGRLMLLDSVIAAIVRTTGAPLEWIFIGAFVASLVLIWSALVLIGHRVYASGWATLALAAAFSLRHHIPQTSANTFEGYFHPRMLAFAFGTLAVAALLRRRTWSAVASIAVAATIHVTTALWFAILVGVALAWIDQTMRRLAGVAVIALAGVAVWALSAGPLRGSMVAMDSVWLQAVATKDSLFAQHWPIWAWAANLGLLVVVMAAHRYRLVQHRATEADTGLVFGAAALVVVFLATLPAVAAHNAFAVQLQISRIFWLVDLVATIYIIDVLWNWKRVLAAVLIAAALGRGAYILGVEHRERGLFALRLDDTRWNDAMRWLAQQPIGIHVLADPDHAWKYGTSVRVSAGRDVYLESVKDEAIAMYSRDVAVRVVDRLRALGDFGTLTPERLRALTARYGLDYLVTDRAMPMPVAYRNAAFVIYRLGADGNLEETRSIGAP